MGHKLRWAWSGLLMAGGLGCMSAPVADSPPVESAAPILEEANPVFIPLGPDAYGLVFENVLKVLSDYSFEIRESNRYDGRIETVPRISPGLGRFLRPGSPDFNDRLLATLQTYRHRVSVVIQPADQGGFFVEVCARKELEDLPRPVRNTAGAAVFRTENNLERQYEVIDPTVFDSTWIFKGRDVPLEQELIRRLKNCP